MAFCLYKKLIPARHPESRRDEGSPEDNSVLDMGDPSSSFAAFRMTWSVTNNGFTLLEVLLALAIISIAFVALFNSILQSTHIAQKLKTKTLKHWVALEGVHMIQLGLLTMPTDTVSSQKTRVFNHTWYWRAQLTKTHIHRVEKITITVGESATGPFTDPLYAFRYVPYAPS